MNSTLLVLAVTLERYLAICWPLKSATWRTSKRAKRTVPTILLFSFFYNSPYLKTSGLSENLLCSAVAKHNTGSKVWAWWGLVLNFIIPFFSLVSMNAFIVRAIHCRGKYLGLNPVRMKRNFAGSSTREIIAHHLNLISKLSSSFESPTELSTCANASSQGMQKAASQEDSSIKDQNDFYHQHNKSTQTQHF